MNESIRVGITLGDPAGVGPEIILKALTDPEIRSLCSPVILGDRQVLESVQERDGGELGLKEVSGPGCFTSTPDRVPIVSLSQLDPKKLEPGRLDPDTAQAVIRYVEEGISLAQAGVLSALVTGPVPKAVFKLAGFEHAGHTEFLAERTGTREFAMMFVGGKLRIVLATIHIPLAEVVQSLSADGIGRKLGLVHRELQRLFRIEQPRIAVAGLNPHAGEGGLLGREEIELIWPAVEAARKEGIQASGPYPPDALFLPGREEEFDCFLAMYHDQGLIPFKSRYFFTGVNVTLGLPIVRTSPT